MDIHKIDTKIEEIVKENNQLVIEIQSTRERLLQLENHQQQLVGRATALRDLKEEYLNESKIETEKQPVEVETKDLKSAVASQTKRK